LHKLAFRMGAPGRGIRRGGSRNADGQVIQDSETYAGWCDQARRVVYQGTSAQGANPNNLIYDASGDPTQISSHHGSGNFDSYTQAFDNAGETTSQTPISGSMGSSSTYSYDTLGDRTTTVTGFCHHLWVSKVSSGIAE
jgi:hypothetical protein